MYGEMTSSIGRELFDLLKDHAFYISSSVTYGHSMRTLYLSSTTANKNDITTLLSSYEVKPHKDPDGEDSSWSIIVEIPCDDTIYLDVISLAHLEGKTAVSDETFEYDAK